jgi:hypothetical protein
MLASPDRIGPVSSHNILVGLINRARGMSTSQFTLSYDGDELRTGQMDVRELGPALLAVGDLLSEANQEVNGGRVTLSVNVQAGFEKGSFDISLITNQGPLSELMSIVTGEHIIVASALVMLLFGGRGLLDLLKFLAGNKPEKLEPQENDRIRLTANHSSITVSVNVFKFYGNPSMRQAVKPLVNPLKRPGIDTLKAISGNKVILEVAKKDVPALTEIDMEEKVISETEREGFLQIHSLSFKEDNKWRLWDGTSSAFYAIEDEDFLRDIDQHSERFGKDDTLRCRIKVTVRLTKEGQLRTELSVVKVLEHIGAARQPRLPLNPPFSTNT